MQDNKDKRIHDITHEGFERLDEAVQMVIWSLHHQTPHQAAAAYKEIWNGIESQFFERYFDEGVFEALLTHPWESFPHAFISTFFQQTELRIDQLISILVPLSLQLQGGASSKLIFDAAQKISEGLQAPAFNSPLNHPSKEDLRPFMVSLNQIATQDGVALDAYLEQNDLMVLSQMGEGWISDQERTQAVLGILRGQMILADYAQSKGLAVHVVQSWVDAFIKAGSQAIARQNFAWEPDSHTLSSRPSKPKSQ